MSKVRKLNHALPSNKTAAHPRVEIGAVSTKRAVVDNEETPRAVTAPMCLPAVDINMLSTVPFYSSRLQSMKSPFTVDKQILDQFNNMNSMNSFTHGGCGSGDSYCNCPRFDTGNKRVTFTLGRSHDTPMGRRLNSKLFVVQSAGYQLAMNGIVGSPLWLCLGDRVDVHYCPGNARRRQNCDAQQKDYLCLSTDPFGGGPHSFTNEFDPAGYNPNFTPSLAAEPVFGTQKIFAGSTQTLAVAPWLSQGIYYMVESAAVGTFCPVIIMGCCNK
jgi:hypothetical protein